MKNLFKLTMVLVASSLVLAGCNASKKAAADPSINMPAVTENLELANGKISGLGAYKKMLKSADAIKASATPQILVLNNGKIAADLSAEIPAGYYNKKAVLRLTPVLFYEGNLVAGESVVLQGEKVQGNGIVVPTKQGLKLNRHVVFDYKPGMDLCELKVMVEALVKSGKEKVFVPVDLNEGALPNSIQLAVLTTGGPQAYAIKSAYGLTVAKGLNTLQKDIDYAAAMDVEANAYKNVTTHVVTADLLYKINSSVVGRKAVKGEEFDALKAAVAANAANDRAVQSVYVNGYASPDGPVNFNDKLSAKRSQSGVKAIEKLLADKSLAIDAASYGEDWEGFKKAVEASNIEDKDIILQVLAMYTSSAEREKEIKNMSSVFKALKTEILPQLRRAQIVNSADITGKTDAEMTALINKGEVSELDLEELLHIAAVNPAVAQPALEYAANAYRDARAYNNLAVVYANAGDYAAAQKALDNAVKAGDKSKEVNDNLALVALGLGDVAKAEQYAKGSSSEDVGALLDAAKGDYKDAAAELTGYNAAVAQVQSGNLAAARKSLASDNSAKADYLRAIIASMEGNTAEAKTQLAAAVAKDASLAKKAASNVYLANIK